MSAQFNCNNANVSQKIITSFVYAGICSNGLKPIDGIIYNYLCNLSDKGSRELSTSNGNIAITFGLSDSTVKRSLAKMLDRGLLKYSGSCSRYRKIKMVSIPTKGDRDRGFFIRTIPQLPTAFINGAGALIAYLYSNTSNGEQAYYLKPSDAMRDLNISKQSYYNAMQFILDNKLAWFHDNGDFYYTMKGNDYPLMLTDLGKGVATCDPEALITIGYESKSDLVESKSDLVESKSDLPIVNLIDNNIDNNIDNEQASQLDTNENQIVEPVKLKADKPKLLAGRTRAPRATTAKLLAAASAARAVDVKSGPSSEQDKNIEVFKPTTEDEWQITAIVDEAKRQDRIFKANQAREQRTKKPQRPIKPTNQLEIMEEQPSVTEQHQDSDYNRNLKALDKYRSLGLQLPNHLLMFEKSLANAV